jgi:hypothetical protein
MKYALALLLLIPPTCLLSQDNTKQLQRLTSEQAKLKRQTDPVARAKTGIKISEVLLTLVSDAANQGNMEVMQQRLTEYTEVVQSAHQTMVQTGRDAHRKPGGFKDLEIAIRRQLRQLEDIGGLLSFDERDPVLKAQAAASEVRDAILKAMFGGQNATSGS